MSQLEFFCLEVYVLDLLTGKLLICLDLVGLMLGWASPKSVSMKLKNLLKPH